MKKPSKPKAHNLYISRVRGCLIFQSTGLRYADQSIACPLLLLLLPGSSLCNIRSRSFNTGTNTAVCCRLRLRVIDSHERLCKAVCGSASLVIGFVSDGGKTRKYILARISYLHRLGAIWLGCLQYVKGDSSFDLCA